LVLKQQNHLYQVNLGDINPISKPEQGSRVDVLTLRA